MAMYAHTLKAHSRMHCMCSYVLPGVTLHAQLCVAWCDWGPDAGVLSMPHAGNDMVGALMIRCCQSSVGCTCAPDEPLWRC